MDAGKLQSLMAEFPWLGEAMRLIPDKELGARKSDGYVHPLHELIHDLDVERSDEAVFRFVPSRIVYPNCTQHLSFVAVFGGSENDRRWRFQLFNESKIDWINWDGMIVEATSIGAQLGGPVIMMIPSSILEVLHLEDNNRRTVKIHKMDKFDWSRWEKRVELGLE